MKKGLMVVALIGMLSSYGWCQGVDTVSLERIVITASRMAQQDYKTASDVTVIDQKDIKFSTAKVVSDILAEQPGISLYDNGTPKTSTVDIRGFGDTANRNVLILVNDRKVNSVDISGPDLLQIPLESVKRIEIIRGAGSVLYGDNATGGVVNIITKEGKGPAEVSVGTSYGSYETISTDLEISGSKDKMSYYLYSRYFDTDGYRENSNLLVKDYNFRGGYEFSKNFKISAFINWHEDDYGLPGGLNDSELASLGRKASADFNDFASSKDRAFQVSLDIMPWPEDLKLGHFVIDTSYRNRDTFALFQAFDFGTKRNIDSLGITGKYIFDYPIFEQDFNFVTGIDFYDTDNDIWGSGSNSDDITISKGERGYYLMAEAEILNKIYANFGTRFQQAEYIFDQRSGTRNYEDQSVRESVSMGGLRYEYGKGSNVFFNVQQTFRFLATDEWYSTWTGLDTDLQQQTGLQYEAGIKHNFNDIVTTSLTPYWIDINNEIFYDPLAGGGWGSNNNYDKTRRRGFEFEQKFNVLKVLDLKMFSDLELTAHYTYQNPKFIKGTNDDKMIPMAPQHQAALGLHVGFQKAFRISLMGRYVGSSYAINDTLNATPPVKPYCLLDLKMSYSKDPVEYYVSINNLTSEKYFTYVTKSTSSTTKDYFPAELINVMAGMKFKF